MDKKRNDNYEPLEGQTSIYDFKELFGLSKGKKKKEKITVPIPVKTQDWLKEKNKIKESGKKNEAKK